MAKCHRYRGQAVTVPVSVINDRLGDDAIMVMSRPLTTIVLLHIVQIGLFQSYFCIRHSALV